ncbi:hypothetical protein OAM04_03065 [bacterium]|nr:hypothetical protein [bacterium]
MRCEHSWGGFGVLANRIGSDLADGIVGEMGAAITLAGVIPRVSRAVSELRSCLACTRLTSVGPAGTFLDDLQFQSDCP